MPSSENVDAAGVLVTEASMSGEMTPPVQGGVEQVTNDAAAEPANPPAGADASASATQDNTTDGGGGGGAASAASGRPPPEGDNAAPPAANGKPRGIGGVAARRSLAVGEEGQEPPSHYLLTDALISIEDLIHIESPKSAVPQAGVVPGYEKRADGENGNGQGPGAAAAAGENGKDDAGKGVRATTPRAGRAPQLRSQSMQHQENIESVSAESLMRCFPRLLTHRLLAGGEVSQGSTQVEAIILFIDVSGFTKIARTLQAASEEGLDNLQQHLNGYFDILVDTVHRHGGDILEFSGDAILGGWFFDLESSLLHSLRCAQELTALDDPHAFSRDGVDYAMTVHIGASLGPVVSHIVGGSGPVEHGLWHHLLTGPGVEAACYASTLAKPREIALSRSFHASINLCGGVAIETTPAEADEEYVIVRSAALPNPDARERRFSVHYLQAIQRNGQGLSAVSSADLFPSFANAQNAASPSVRCGLGDAHGRSRNSLMDLCSDEGDADADAGGAGSEQSGSPRSGRGVMIRSPDVHPKQLADCSTLLSGITNKQEVLALMRAMPKSSMQQGVLELIKPRMALFSSNTLLHALNAAQPNELRMISSVFIRLVHGKPGSNADTSQRHLGRRFHQAVRAVQTSVARWGGVVNKILMDDKGIIVLCFFGVPRHTHDNDADRSVHFAMAVEKKLRTILGRVAIGVTRARNFSGLFGNEGRQEQTALGQGINDSARLMQECWRQQQARRSSLKVARDSPGTGPASPVSGWGGGVLCDGETIRCYKSTQYSFKDLGLEPSGRVPMFGVYSRTAGDGDGTGQYPRDPIRRLHASSTRSDLSSSSHTLLSLAPPSQMNLFSPHPAGGSSPRSSMLSMISRSTGSSFYLSINSSMADLLGASGNGGERSPMVNPILPAGYNPDAQMTSPKRQRSTRSAASDTSDEDEETDGEFLEALADDTATSMPASPAGGGGPSVFKVFGMVQEQSAVETWAAQSRRFCERFLRPQISGRIKIDDDTTNGLIFAGGVQSGKTVLLAKAQEILGSSKVVPLSFVGEATPTPFHTLKAVFVPMMTEASVRAAASSKEFLAEHPAGVALMPLLHLVHNVSWLAQAGHEVTDMPLEMKVQGIAALLLALCRVCFRSQHFAFLVDDAHSIDPESWAFFHAALEADVPMLMIFGSENYTSMEIYTDKHLLKEGSMGSQRSDTSTTMDTLSAGSPRSLSSPKGHQVRPSDDGGRRVSLCLSQPAAFPPVPPMPPPQHVAAVVPTAARRKSSVRFTVDATARDSESDADSVSVPGVRQWRSLSKTDLYCDTQSVRTTKSTVPGTSLLRRIQSTPGARATEFRDKVVQSLRCECYLIQALPAADVAALIKHMLECKEVEDVLLGFVMDKSGGIPGWIYMITECLLAHRTITVQPTKRAVLVLRDHSILRTVIATIPTLQVLVLKRLDAFSPGAASLLHMACIIALVQPRFTAQLLVGCMNRLERERVARRTAGCSPLHNSNTAQKMAETAEATLHVILAEGFFLSPLDPATSRVLHFTYSVVQDVLYHSLPRRQRAELHAVVGSFLKESSVGTAPQRAVGLGLHFYLAGEREQATRYLADGYQAAVDAGDLPEIQQRLNWLSRCAAQPPAGEHEETAFEEEPLLAEDDDDDVEGTSKNKYAPKPHVEKWALDAMLCAYELGSLRNTEADCRALLTTMGLQYPVKKTLVEKLCCCVAPRADGEAMRVSSAHAAVVLFEIALVCGDIKQARDIVALLQTQRATARLGNACAACLAHVDANTSLKALAKPFAVTSMSDALPCIFAEFAKDADTVQFLCDELWMSWPEAQTNPHRLKPGVRLGVFRDGRNMNGSSAAAVKQDGLESEDGVEWPQRPSVQAHLLFLIGIECAVRGAGQRAYSVAVEISMLGEACFAPRIAMLAELLRCVVALYYDSGWVGFIPKSKLWVSARSPKSSVSASTLDCREGSFRFGMAVKNVRDEARDLPVPAFVDRNDWIREDECAFTQALLASNTDLPVDDGIKRLCAAVRLHHVEATGEEKAWDMLSDIITPPTMVTPIVAYATMLGIEAALRFYYNLPGWNPRWRKALLKSRPLIQRAAAGYPFLRPVAEYVACELDRRIDRADTATLPHYTVAAHPIPTIPSISGEECMTEGESLPELPA